MRPAYPHERRVQRWAYASLAATAAVGAALVLRGAGDLPPALLLAVLAAGAILGAVAVHRRSGVLALGAGAVMVLALLPGGTPDPGLAGYALGLLFGALLLGFGEAVHNTVRYDRAHAAVEKDGLPEDHLDRVTDEALKTLLTRALLAAGVAGAGVLAAYALAALGPLQAREAVETTGPLGVAVASLSLMGGAALFVLVRGSRLRRQAAQNQETAPDAQD